MINYIKLVLVSFLCGAGISLPSKNVVTNKIYRSLSNEVHVGDFKELPMIDITHNEVTKTSNRLIITTPNGNKFEDNKITFSEAGKYLLTYSTDFDGENISKVVEITSIRRPENMFVSDKGIISRGSFAYNSQLSESVGVSEYNGIKIKSFDNTTVYFDKILDFSKLDKNVPFLDFIIEPSKQGKYDLGELLFTLTDADDENNKVYIRYVDGYVGSGHSLRMSYATAFANDQTKAGYDPHYNVYHVGSDYTGTPIGLSFRGLNEQSLQLEGGYKNSELFFDYANSSIYVKTVYTTLDSKSLLNDLDNSDLYSTNPWNGFKNGKAKLSITTKDVGGTGCTYLIKSIFDYDLTKDEFRDEIAPSIKIDYGKEDPNNLPLSKIGASYPIFNAIADDNFDDDLFVKVKTSYYDESTAKYISVQNNGKYFKTQNPGKYLVNYSCEDRTGNKVEENIFLYCTFNSENLEIIVPEDSNNYEVYDKIALPSLDEVVVNNARGHVNLARSLTSPDGKTIPLNSDFFVPDMIGEYKVSYSATDIFNVPTTKVYSYKIHNISHPVIIQDISLPRVMIKGFSYEIPVISCKYPSGEEILDGNTSVYINDELYTDSTYLVQSLDPVKINYVPNGSILDKKEFIINVIDPLDGDGKLRKLNYFYSNDGTFTSSTPEGGSCKFFVNDSSTINFANYISSNDLSLSMQLDEATLANYSSLEIILSDFKNSNNKVTFEISPYGDNLRLKAPFNNKMNVLSCTSNKTFTLNYNSLSKLITDSNKNKVCKIQYFDDGREFSGFSDAIYFSFRLKEVVSESAVSVVSINNQTFKSSVVGDNVGPQIITCNDFESAQGIYTELVIKKAKAFDVLSSVKSLTISVTRRSDGKALLNNLDATIDQTIRFDQYGEYDIKYVAKDSNNKTSTQLKTISCKENDPPKLNIYFTPAENYKLNSSFKLPTFTLSDNCNNAKVDVTLYFPLGEAKLLQHGELVYGSFALTSYLDSSKYGSNFVVNDSTFNFIEQGRYILRYFAIDNYGNFTIQEYNLFVI